MMSNFIEQQRMFNANGNQQAVNTKPEKEGLLILGGIVLMGLAIILKK